MGRKHESQRLRELAALRSSGKCGICGRDLRDGLVLWEVDHIVRVCDGGNDDPDNLQAACLDCHKAKSARERCQDFGEELTARAFTMMNESRCKFDVAVRMNVSIALVEKWFSPQAPNRLPAEALPILIQEATSRGHADLISPWLTRCAMRGEDAREQESLRFPPHEIGRGRGVA